MLKSNNELRTELSEMKTSNANMKEKITNLETEIEKLKLEPIQQSTKENIGLQQKSLLLCSEDTIIEFQERSQRQKNIVIAGISELHTDDTEQKRKHDSEEVLKLIKSIYNDCPTPLKTMRLGKYLPGKNRLIKICFNSADTAKYLLRNQTKNDNNIRLYSDQTPAQRNYMLNLKEELIQRENSGETNLCTKYIRGVPKIIKNAPKNSL